MIGSKCIHLKRVDSTNNYVAKLLLDGKIDHGSVVLADFQEFGRGQRGKNWETGEKTQFTASYFLKTEFLSVHQLPVFNKMIALSITKAILHLKFHPINIKWPNDILINDKKIAGILIETQLSASKINSVIVGVGLNLVNPEINDAISLEELEIMCSNNEFLQLLNNQLNIGFEKIKRFEFSDIENEYENYLWRKSVLQIVTLLNGEKLSGKIIGVNSEGILCFETVKKIHYFRNQEVVFDRN